MRTIALLILALTASSVMSDCAGDNFIASSISLTPEAAGTTHTIDNTYTTTCGFASSATVCCTNTQMSGLQDNIDTLISNLEDAAGTRDEYIIARRGDVIEVLSSLRSMYDAIERADNDDTSLGSLAIVVNAFSGLADTVTQNFTGLVENFEEYQKARATCLQGVITAQASIWCAACTDAGLPAGFTATDATPANGGTVALSDATNTALAGLCYDYIQYSANQSSIISLYTVRNGLSDLASALTNLVDGNLEQAATDLASAVTTLGTITNPTGTYEKPVEVPSDCASASDCDWLVALLSTGELSNTDLILGGDEVTLSIVSVSSRRVLREAGEGRRLQYTAETDPTALGFTIEFAENPAGVDNTENANSAIRNGIVACAVAALALFF